MRKSVLKNLVAEFRPELPVIYNVNFGHASPINIIPYGVECELDCDNKKIVIVEKMLEDNLCCEKGK